MGHLSVIAVCCLPQRSTLRVTTLTMHSVTSLCLKYNSANAINYVYHETRFQIYATK